MNDFFRTFMGSGARPWIRNDGSERLFTLRLTGVENALDPDPLWESTYGGGPQIKDQLSNSHNRRLKTALDAHRKISPEWDDFGFPVEKMLVFSDVILWIPEKIWKSSAREGGERLFMLSEKLKYRHRTDFNEELYKNQDPHYAIMPLKELATDEVIFQFGLGVYLPRENDTQTAIISISQTGKEPLTLPPWIFFENEKEIERPSSLYSAQHFLLIGNTLAESAIQSPHWFQQDQGYLMIDTHRQPNRIYGDDEYIEAGKMSLSADITLCPFYTTKNKESLQLLIDRTPASTTKFNDDTFTGTDIDNPLGGLTVIETDDTPLFRFHLAITGIILPKIPHPNIKYWLLHLNQQAMPSHEDEEIIWSIRGNKNKLEWKESQSKQWLTLDITQALPFPEGSPLQCKEAIIKEKQHAILILPQSLAHPLSHKEITLGRTPNNDFTLELLSQNNSIQWRENSQHQQQMGHLGLSARHLKLKIEGQKLQVTQCSTSSPSHILQDSTIIKTLEPNSLSQSLLTSGQEIIVGNYLLQYSKESTHNIKA